MEQEKRTTRITAQGRETPVMVGVGSGRAGSPRPLANDCSSSMVDSQAGAMVSASGEWEGLRADREDQIFGRRSSLARTPPKVPPLWMSSASASDGTDERREGESVQLSKRKRRESPREKEERSSKILDEVMSSITGIREMAKELSLLAKNNPNTKVEIKRVVGKLERQAENLWKRSAALRPMRIERPRPECCSVSVQTVEQAAGWATAQAEERVARDSMEVVRSITNQIRDCRKEEDFLKCVQRAWPEEVYKISREEVGNPLDKDGDVVVITCDAKLDRGVGKMVRGRYPDLEEVELETKGEVCAGYLITSIRRKEAGTFKTTDRLICKVACDTAEEGNIRSNLLKMT